MAAAPYNLLGMFCRFVTSVETGTKNASYTRRKSLQNYFYPNSKYFFPSHVAVVVRGLAGASSRVRKAI